MTKRAAKIDALARAWMFCENTDHTMFTDDDTPLEDQTKILDALHLIGDALKRRSDNLEFKGGVNDRHVGE